MSNPYTSIPEPSPTLEGLQAAVAALKQTVEALAGQRGTGDHAAVTWADLATLGVTNPDGEGLTISLKQFTDQSDATDSSLSDLADAITAITPAAVADGTMQANISGAAAVPSAHTVSSVLDAVLGSTRGAMLYRGASGWAILPPSVAGHVLTDGGAGADPSFAAAPSYMWEKISETAFSGEAEFTATDLGSYRALRLLGLSIRPSVDAGYAYIQLSSNNGSSYLTTNYSWNLAGTPSAFAIYNQSPDISGTSGHDGITFARTIMNFGVAHYTSFFATGPGASTLVDTASSTRIMASEIWGIHSSQTAMNALKFAIAGPTANLASGTLILEGMK